MEAVLSDVERRIVANLSIPRNVADIASMLRQDVAAPNLSEEEVHRLLSGKDDGKGLLDQGLVVNLGDGRAKSTGELAAAVDQHKRAVSMPDEKAKIFEKRLAAAHHRWRMDGDVYAFTGDALELLTAPVKDEPASLIKRSGVDALLREIQEHSKNVVTDFKEGKTSLAGGKFMPDEFSLWLGDVLDHAKKELSPEELKELKKQIPIGGGSQFSDAYEISIGNAWNQKTALGAVVDPFYLALVTVAVTDADTGSTLTEATGATGYARKSVAAADMGTVAGTGGASSNVNAIVFAAITAGSATVIGFAHCVAATVGVMRSFGTCASTVISSTQTPPQFAVGAYTQTVA